MLLTVPSYGRCWSLDVGTGSLKHDLGEVTTAKDNPAITAALYWTIVHSSTLVNGENEVGVDRADDNDEVKVVDCREEEVEIEVILILPLGLEVVSEIEGVWEMLEVEVLFALLEVCLPLFEDVLLVPNVEVLLMLLCY